MTEKAGAALVWCPFPETDSAAAAARALLAEGLVACANILPPMRSLYIWRGESADEQEVGVLFKTNAARLEQVTARLGELHPYDEPAILGWRCDAAAPATIAWLAALGGSADI